MYETHPISQVQWKDVNSISANDWNPNIVQSSEFKLLKFSLLRQGWIQPILVSTAGEDKYEVIDGYHRWSLAKTDQEVHARTGGKVPVVILDLTVPERKLLTVRINRAKGSHAAFKMHEIVFSLINDYQYTVEQVCEGIGADPYEVNTLLMKNLFEKKEVARVPYSKSWIPMKAEKPKKEKVEQ